MRCFNAILIHLWLGWLRLVCLRELRDDDKRQTKNHRGHQNQIPAFHPSPPQVLGVTRSKRRFAEEFLLRIIVEPDYVTEGKRVQVNNCEQRGQTSRSPKFRNADVAL